jgi:16S rRNA processing protein RimM
VWLSPRRDRERGSHSPGEEALTDESQWIAIGVITRPRGIRGEVSVIPLTSRPERFSDLHRVFLFGDGAPFEVESVWEHSGRWIFKFRGVDSITDAERLRAAEIRVPAGERAPVDEGEFFHSDLEGCEVVDASGRSLGQVAGFVEAGGSGLLELTSGLLIPFARAICREIDTVARRIVVDLPEGLEEVNPT